MEHLLRKKTYSCGTIQLNRVCLPDAIKEVTLENSGDMIKRRKGSIMAVAWEDGKRTVKVITSANSKDNVICARHGKLGQPDVRYTKPKAIVEYTDHFNAVDKNDQLRSYYGIAHRAKKWWEYIFWFFMDVTMINAYILHKDAPGGPRPHPLTHLQFHIALAKGLIGRYSSRKREASIYMEVPRRVIKKNSQA